MKKVDIYNHVFPKPYWDYMIEVAGKHRDLGKRVREIPMLYDLDERFRVMDSFGPDYVQILSVAQPPPEALGGPDVAAELARRANDGMAELCDKYPDRFPAFIAKIAPTNMEATIAEMRRAITELGARGVEICTNVAGHPLDEERFEPVFQLMAEEYDLPIWVHPVRPATFADYASEDASKYEIWWTLGWPYETSAFMARIVFSGLFDKYPNLKIITHHMGGMIPYFEGRVGPGWDQMGTRTSGEDLSQVLKKLKKPHLDYFKMFYADTAVFGAKSATVCGLDFFGVDNVVFASDAPFDPEGGPMYIRETIKILDALDLSDAARKQIYQGNAERLLKIKVE